MWLLLLRSQLRVLRQSSASTAAALLGITLGVVSVVAVHLVSSQISKNLDAAVATHLNTAAFIAQGAAESSRVEHRTSASEYFALRRAWRVAQYSDPDPNLDPKVHASLQAVTGMYPVLEGTAILRLADTERRIQLVGVDWISLIDADTMRSASAPSLPFGGEEAPQDGVAAGEIAGVLDAQLAKDLGLRLGARFSINGHSLRLTATVPASAMGMLLPRLYVELGSAQQLLGSGPDVLTAVALVVPDSQQSLRSFLEQLMPGISAVLPRPPTPHLPGAWRVSDVQQQLPHLTFGRSVLFNLGALGFLSLVVAWFLIYQAAVLWLRRQANVFSRLQALGVTMEQMRLVFVLVLLLLGSIAAVIGVVGGQGLAVWLLQRGGLPNVATEFGLLQLPLAVWLKAFVSGVVVAFIAAWLALRRVLPGMRANESRVMRFVWPMLLVLGLAYGLWQGSGLVGGFLAIGVLCVVAVALLAPMLGWLRNRAAALKGPLLWRMGLRELAWYPMDVATALAALMLALATSIGVATMVDSFRVDFSLMLEQRLSAQVQITGNHRDLAAVEDYLAQAYPKLQIKQQRTLLAQVLARPVDLVSYPLDAAGAARYAHEGPLRSGEALVSEQFARSIGLAQGSTFALGEREYRLVGIFPGYGEMRGQILLPAADPVVRAMFAESQGEQNHRLRLDLYSPLVWAETRTAALMAELQAHFPSLDVQSQQNIRNEALRVFDQTFVMTRGLTFIALLVASVGLYSTLLGIGLIQRASWQLLQVLGLKPQEGLLAAVARSLGVTAVVLVFALPLGLAMGWLLCQVINPRAFGWSIPMVISTAAITTPALLALLAALVTGILGSVTSNRQLTQAQGQGGLGDIA